MKRNRNMKTFEFSPKFVIFLTVIWGFLQTTLGATQAPKDFEGELHYRSLENHDKNIVKYSYGMAYNGARDVTIIIKNNNVLYRDECTKITILLNNKNKVVVYSDILKEGLEFDYDKYTRLYLGTFSPEGPLVPYRASLYSKVRYNPLPPTLYDFKDSVYSTKILNMDAVFVKGRIENTYAGTDFDIIKIPGFNMPINYYTAQLYGIKQHGLITKFIWEQNNKSILGTMKSYVCTELKQITERTVATSEFEIPQEIKIKKGTALRLLKLHKKSRNYLKKHKMYPTFTQTDVIYQIDDESWDF